MTIRPSAKQHTVKQHRIRFPEMNAEIEQDQEWFEVLVEGTWRRMRVHDYREIYKIPGLYDALVYEQLRCRSPRVVTKLLREVLESQEISAEDLRVLDLRAGNGIVGELLRRLGVGQVVGVDLLPEAAMAAERDRPGVYDDYVVADLTELPPEQAELLQKADYNLLTTVAALGFGDIPPRAFAAALNQISNPGHLAMCIKEDFLAAQENPFAILTQRLEDDGIVEPQARLRYRHRTTVTGEPIFYVALIGRKVADISEELLAQIAA
jgi:SAM-dependent methyltransferase